MRAPGIFLTLTLTLTLQLAPAVAHDLSGAPTEARGAKPPELLEVIDLGKEIPGMAGRVLRMRKLVLEPGGAIPPHGHADRPAMVYVLQGRVREHRSDRPEPVEYGAGETIAEHQAVHHWIESIGDEPLIGVVVDIPNTGDGAAFSTDEVLDAYRLPKHDH